MYLQKVTHQNWSEQIYTIHDVDLHDFPVMYTIIDYNTGVIKGKFYAQELQKVKHPETFPIEKVFRRQGKRILVKFLGYPEKYWVNNIVSL